MSGGYGEPYCNTCRYFKVVLFSGEKRVEVLRTIPDRCICTLHDVYVPMHETVDCLVCEDWTECKPDAKPGDAELDGLEMVKGSRILYSYRGIYDLPAKIYKKIDDLPKVI